MNKLKDIITPEQQLRMWAVEHAPYISSIDDSVESHIKVAEALEHYVLGLVTIEVKDKK